MKEQVKRVFKGYIVCQQTNKQTKNQVQALYEIFLNPPKGVQGRLYPLFQNQCTHFLLLSLFWRITQVRMNKIVNDHTVDYHPSSSELTSRISHLIFYFYKLLRVCLSQEYSLNFFSNLYVQPCLGEFFKFM